MREVRIYIKLDSRRRPAACQWHRPDSKPFDTTDRRRVGSSAICEFVIIVGLILDRLFPHSENMVKEKSTFPPKTRLCASKALEVKVFEYQCFDRYSIKAFALMLTAGVAGQTA